MTSYMRSIGLLLVSANLGFGQANFQGNYSFKGNFNIGKATTPVAYDWRETFETAVGYDLTGWSETGGGTLDEDFSTAGLSLEGSQCLKITGSASESYSARAFSPARGEAWVVGYFRFAQLPANSTIKFIRMNGTVGAVSMFFVYINSTGTIQCEDQNGAGLSTATTDTVAINTSYKWRFHYKKGATTSTCDFEFNTTSFDGAGNDYTATTANGTTNIDGDQLYIYAGKGAGAGVIIHYDDVVLDDTLLPFAP